MSTLSQFFGNGSPIKSIQRGTISMPQEGVSATATISSVNTSKTMISLLGITTSETSANLNQYLTRISLTNSTTVTIDRVTGFAASGTRTLIVSYEVIEFN
jgi:hypothetical protein